MDYLTSDKKKLLVFYQPYHSTTSGHTTIRKIISEAIDETTVLVTFTAPSQLQSWLERTPRKPDLLLVDFPDSGHRKFISEIRHQSFMRGVPLAYVDMFAPSPDPDPTPRIAYDMRFAFDPYSMDDERPPATHWLDVGPLLLTNRIVAENVPDNANIPLQERCFVCETGSATERDLLTLYAARHRVHKDWPLTRSRSVPQNELLDTAAKSGEIWAAGGYSMTWELAARVPLQRVNWMLLDRQSEDCARRILRAMKLQFAGVPLLLQQDRPLIRNKLAFQSYLTRILRSGLAFAT
jgi:hypothetical protein